MTLVITLYDEIGPGDAARVLQLLNGSPGDDVEVRLNSPGGVVSEGLAIYNALKARKPTVYIDGVVASIASLIAMAGKPIIAAENSLLMIHDPWTAATGNPSQLRRTADLLDKHLDAMVGAYARSGMKEGRLRELMAAETWMTATEAWQLGFVDEVGEPLRYAAHSPAAFAGYLNTPEILMTDNNHSGEPAGNPNAPAAPSNGDTIEASNPAPLSADELRQRNSHISVMAKINNDLPGIADLVSDALADSNMPMDRFNERVVALRREVHGVATPTGWHREPAASGGDPAGRDFVVAASDALALQAGVKVDKPHAGARDVAGMGLHGIIRACAQRSGRYNGTSLRESIRAALSTSDFPAILENSLNKALRSGYGSEQQTFTAWTRLVTVPDFKEQSRVLLGSAPDLEPVAEGGEYTYGSMDEDRATYRVNKYGKLVRFTWEAMVNDDLGAFLRTTQAMGLAAARAEADNIYNTFAVNGGEGPQMQDGANLFHNTHANVAGTSAALDADALGAARVLLRRQTGLGGGVLNLAPRFLLVAPEYEQAAEILLAAAARSISQGSDNALIPAWLARLELVVEARLSDDAVYLLTSPELIDTVERGWLESDNGPVIEEKDGFTTDDRMYKVRHVFGARWLDWRGAVKLPISS